MPGNVFASSVVPDNFKVIAHYAPGYSDWKPWEATITQDGKVSQTTYIFGDNENTEIIKTFSLSEHALTNLIDAIKEPDFFSIKERFSYPVTHNETLFLSVTMGQASHEVSVYAPSHLKKRTDVKRFLAVWDEVLKKVPSPNNTDDVNRRHRAQVVVSTEDTPEDMLMKLGCGACHKVPTTTSKFGTIGPVLIAKTNAAERIASRDYRAQLKAGKAHATTAKEYVIESIVDPGAFIVPNFRLKHSPEGSTVMPQDYGSKFTYDALNKLADFLLSLDEAAAIRDGMLHEK